MCGKGEDGRSGARETDPEQTRVSGGCDGREDGGESGDLPGVSHMHVRVTTREHSGNWTETYQGHTVWVVDLVFHCLENELGIGW